MAQKWVFTPIFGLHTDTTGSGFRNFDVFLRILHLLTEIYPLVPLPHSLMKGVSVYRSSPLRRTPLTRADARSGHERCAHDERNCRREQKSWGTDAPTTQKHHSLKKHHFACGDVIAVSHETNHIPTNNNRYDLSYSRQGQVRVPRSCACSRLAHAPLHNGDTNGACGRECRPGTTDSIEHAPHR